MEKEKAIIEIKIRNKEFVTLSFLILGIELLTILLLTILSKYDFSKENIINKLRVYNRLIIILTIPTALILLTLLTHVRSSIKIYSNRIEYYSCLGIYKILNGNIDDLEINELNKAFGSFSLGFNNNPNKIETVFTYIEKSVYIKKSKK